ncbi:hypothetical protein BFJ69_g16488 [Fusarium oxysporum]|uniref:MULE transposase domain-containing protein n=1 Tax=Fusarium oxysporum TaxID=5507 RepID=A0A420MB15_FUSOX|nr:hypothetical protein BFJ69_g16488 [Fusarium oxysporum]
MLYRLPMYEQACSSPPLLTNRPPSASSTATSSTATSIGKYYGIGDEDTLGNLFASYPQTFSTIPQPHGSQGLHEPAWDLRFDYEIYLQNDFLSRRMQHQRVRAPIPGPEIDPLPSNYPPESIQQPPIATKAEFESVMKVVREVIGEGRRLTIDLARSYERGRKIRLSLRCDRYGEPEASKGVGLRKRKSCKCGCKWVVIAEALEEGKLLLRQHPNLQHSQHNHRPSITSSAHPSHRRLTTPVRATIESTSRRVGIRARDVRAIVEEQHPESTFTQRDIYNARALINRDKLNGYTPTAALIKLFDDMEIPYLVKWADDQPNRLLGLVWTFPYCIQMWKRFPGVISFDNTYSTNRFKLPLFQATGQTCLGTVFNASFGLIDNERREGFQFLAESIRQLIEQHSVRQPDVMITDFDNPMKAALND